jgi:azurin
VLPLWLFQQSWPGSRSTFAGSSCAKAAHRSLGLRRAGSGQSLPAAASRRTLADGLAARVSAGLGLQFATRELAARPGERLSLTLDNRDVLPHNWVLVAADRAAQVGALADLMISAPDALVRHYVPDTPDVLVWTDLVAPQGTGTVHFHAPTAPGNYPHLCTFPGHPRPLGRDARRAARARGRLTMTRLGATVATRQGPDTRAMRDTLTACSTIPARLDATAAATLRRLRPRRSRDLPRAYSPS